MDSVSNLRDKFQLTHLEEIPHTEGLPIDLTLHIFSWLSPKELTTCAQVCKTWKILSSNNVLWRRHLGSLPTPPDGNIKKMLIEQAVDSTGAVVSELNKFILKNQQNYSWCFNVIFTHDPSLYIKIKRWPSDSNDIATSNVTRCVMKRWDSQVSIKNGGCYDFAKNDTSASITFIVNNVDHDEFSDTIDAIQTLLRKAIDSNYIGGGIIL